jgi:hypothetical protein
MSTHTRRPLPTTLAALATLTAALTVLAHAPDAQARERPTTVTGAAGRTATRDVSRSQGDVHSSTTGPNGGSWARSVDRSATGTSASMTGPNGNTATRTTTRTDSGSTTELNGANGGSASVTVTH